MTKPSGFLGQDSDYCGFIGDKYCAFIGKRITTKSRQKRFTVANIKIEKIVEQDGKKKNVQWAVSIRQGSRETSFNAGKKSEVWKRLKEEVFL